MIFKIELFSHELATKEGHLDDICQKSRLIGAGNMHQALSQLLHLM